MIKNKHHHYWPFLKTFKPNLNVSFQRIMDSIKDVFCTVQNVFYTQFNRALRTNRAELGRFRGCLLGLACGDAVGTAVEFKVRGTFKPVTDMVGGGPFNLNIGEWTDDTSMALCLAASLIERGQFDAKDQMEKYCLWMNTGYMSSNGRFFDIGHATLKALRRFQQTGVPFLGSTDKYSAGNGCLMRLAPIPMFFYPNKDSVIDMAANSSRTTHAAHECIEASQLFGAILFMALSGGHKEDILLGHGITHLDSDALTAIAQGEYRNKKIYEVRGSGYVVESLEAALWCFWHTHTFQGAILQAANLGDDADTTAAICGQIAGAYYGEANIPSHWKKRLVMKNEILSMADKLYRHEAVN
ncbi:MAG: ADP-ribosylglycohydrolase family protein [Pseudobdellovibrionaceae bacterium]